MPNLYQSMMSFVAQKRLAGLLGLIMTLAACSNPAYLTGSVDQMVSQYLAISANEAQRVGFTEARQAEILRDFGCSNVRMVQETNVIQSMYGENCAVFGMQTPRMSVDTVGVGVSFSSGKVLSPPLFNQGCWEDGQRIFDALRSREAELANIVFEGRARGDLRGVAVDVNNQLCDFVIHPKFN